MADFPYKTSPFEHQREALRRSANSRFYALLMEQGTGKTKVILDTTGHLARRRLIDGLLVVAPNGVHRNWLTDEIPVHLIDEVPYRGYMWSASYAGTKDAQRDFQRLLSVSDRLPIFTINVDSVITPRGRAAVRSFLERRKTLMVVDESSDIKTPGKKRTRAITALGRLAPYRRILDGTASTESPFELYSQFNFLSPHILQSPTYTAYKHTYAVMEKRRQYRDGDEPGEPTGRPFEVVKNYRNLESLKELIAPHSFRVLKDDVLDLPPKLYTKWYIELSPEQQRMYRELQRNFLTEFEDGRSVTATMTLTRWLRLQQIGCGFVPVDPFYDENQGMWIAEPKRRIPGRNTSLIALEDVIQRYPGKTIIWSRFTADIDLVMRTLGRDQAVRYDGTCRDWEKDEAKKRFQRGDARFFVANQAACARGLTLHAAKNMIYYSNYFSLRLRQQSEDRGHRIGLMHPINIIDFVRSGTIDEKIIVGYRKKKKISDIITGDPHKDWI